MRGASDSVLSPGFALDPATKTLSEIRAAERRKIPLEVYLKASPKYDVHGPIEITVILTNLFSTPLLLNSRMLVNHERLQGELSFRVTGPDGQRVDIRSLVTPLSIRDEDFVILERGESIQRTLDLSDTFGIKRKGIYQIRVCYHNEVDYVAEGHRAWKGRVWSEPVELQVL